MAKRTCSNLASSRFKSCVWMLLRFLYRFLKTTMGTILQIIDKPQWKAIPQQIQSTGVSVYQITKTLQFITEEKARLEFDPQTFKLANPTGKPLCVMFTWMFARQKYVDRYAQIYLEQGFDILTVGLTALHAMWPANGTSVTAENAVKFLYANDSAAPIIVHGFSSGALMWGQVCVVITNNKEKYQPILERVVIQVWDSMVNFNVAYKGFPMSIFPKNKFMQNAMSWFFKLFFRLFHNDVMIPTMRAYHKFQDEPRLVPALIFVSSTDPLGSESTSRYVKKKWTSLGIKVTFKCWDESPHVQHLATHPEEYLTLLYSHMGQVGLLKDIEKRTKYGIKLTAM